MSSPPGAELQKMPVQPTCSWTSLWIVLFLLRHVSAHVSSVPTYTLHNTSATFVEATQSCSPGALTTIATEQEVSEIHKLVSSRAPFLGESTFWIGLKKEKNGCIYSQKPLRGFSWTESGQQESQVDQWAEEPTPTCTSMLCAALKVQFSGGMVSRWGFVPVSCKSSYQFICKLKNGLMATPDSRRTVKPPTGQPTAESEPAAPGTRTTTSKPEAAAAEAELEPNTSDSCQHPIIPSARSLSLDPDNSSKIQVECWSPIRLDLFCSGNPAAWRVLDGSPANISAICLQCEAGFQKDASGRCVDVDECSGAGGASCRHACLNTQGSYRCVCSDPSGNHHDDASPLCEATVPNPDDGSLLAILIPVLVAVAALVVLVVLVAVTVKCCLMRRSKKRAIKKAERMAMKSKHGKDFSETANERAAA